LNESSADTARYWTPGCWGLAKLRNAMNLFRPEIQPYILLQIKFQILVLETISKERLRISVAQHESSDSTIAVGIGLGSRNFSLTPDIKALILNDIFD
jgi:hypothetical protein